MSNTRTGRHWPLSFLALAAAGLGCLLLGLLSFGGALQSVHPLFGDSFAAGLALIVSAIALLLSAAFPLVLRRLAEQDPS